METLETISSCQKYNAKSRANARCLSNGLCVFKLIMLLCVSRQLLAHFKSVTIALQGVGVDIVSVFSMIKTVKDTLQNVSHVGYDLHPKLYEY